MNILFVCSKNRWRSPTAEAVFADRKGWAVASAGLSKGSPVLLTRELVLWADRIYGMEAEHLRKIKARFGEELKGKELKSLGIPDKFPFMDPRLIALLKKKLRAA